MNTLLGESGKVWAVNYFDRYIRDDDHFERTLAYVLNNRIRAGLDDDPAEGFTGLGSALS